MKNIEFQKLTDQIYNNHLDVCNRLTAIETTMQVQKEAYGGIPGQIQELQQFRASSKTAVKIITGSLAVLWAGLLALVEHKKW